MLASIEVGVTKSAFKRIAGPLGDGPRPNISRVKQDLHSLDRLLAKEIGCAQANGLRCVSLAPVLGTIDAIAEFPSIVAMRGLVDIDLAKAATLTIGDQEDLEVVGPPASFIELLELS